jgi:hypothetical protein
LKKLSTSLYLNEDGNLALVQLTNGNWVVISKDDRKVIYGPDKYFSSAKLYLKIMDKEETYEVSKKSS